jgi:hypothetical protein
MNHTRLTSLYNPLSHTRVDVAQIKPTGLPRKFQNVTVEMRQGDPDRAPGNTVSPAEAIQHDKHAFHRRRGVTEFMDITHPYKANFSDNFADRISRDPKVFFPVKGAMVAWMEAAIVGKSKIPFRKTQPVGV